MRAAELPKGRHLVPIVVRQLALKSIPKFIHCSVVVALFALFSFAPIQEASAGTLATPSFFGSKEIRRFDLANLNKWRSILERHASVMEKQEKCTYYQSVGCAQQEWAAIVEEYRDQSLAEKVTAVNREINRLDYVEDVVAYGHDDYWASPMEFFIRGGGDCEDFAISKYLMLEAMGVSTELMRVVVLETSEGIGHAVLIVESAEGKMVLDNQIYEPVIASTISNYQPIYSVNSTSWWLHITN